MRQSTPVIAVGLLLAVFVAAGCGGGGDASSTSGSGASAGAVGKKGESSGGEAKGGESAPKPEPAPASKSAFVAKANALCAKRRRQLQVGVRKIFEGATDEGSRQAAMRRLVGDVVAPGLESEAETLRALEPPQGDAGKVNAIVAAIEAVVAEAREDPTAFVTDPSALTKAHRLARAYGIGACGTAS